MAKLPKKLLEGKVLPPIKGTYEGCPRQHPEMLRKSVLEIC